MFNYSDDSIHEINTSKPITENNSISLGAMKECSVVLDQLDPSQVSNLDTDTSSTTTESLVSLVQSKYSTSTSSNDVFYVADSDEEAVTCSNGLTNAATSTSGSIHVRRMSVLMMAKNSNN